MKGDHPAYGPGAHQCVGPPLGKTLQNTLTWLANKRTEKAFAGNHDLPSPYSLLNYCQQTAIE